MTDSREQRRSQKISTHTPLAGRDSSRPQLFLYNAHFYSHAPRGARYTACADTANAQSVISTHTPLAWRDDTGVSSAASSCISTHTPLAGRDKAEQLIRANIDISTHTPLAGRDVTRRIFAGSNHRFLLTRPSRGAICLLCPMQSFSSFLLTRPSRGAISWKASWNVG